MQKVGQDRRFWWRALEAPTSEPLLSDVDSHPVTGEQVSALPISDFTPTIPALDLSPMASLPGERRRVVSVGRRKSRRRGVFMSALVVLAAGTAVAGATVVDRDAFTDVSVQTAAWARQGAVMAGFGIGQVSLTGHRYTKDNDVFNALDLENVRTFWDLDAREAVHRIERIAWVDKAEITRLFPSALRIDIRERSPALIWSRGEQDYLIDNTGRVLASLEAGHTWRLPRVVGEGANTELVALFSALSSHAGLSSDVLHAERISERRWRLVSTSGSWIELGAEREADGLNQVASSQKLAAAFSGPPVIIDVRTTGRVTIRQRAIDQKPPSRQSAVSALVNGGVSP